MTTSALQTHNPIMEPFDFQVECIDNVYSFWRNGVQRVLLIAGCGAGKTYMASLILKKVTQQSQFRRRCLFLVDRNNLLEQAASEMAELGVNCTILQGDRPIDFSAPVIIVSCQSLEARIRSSGLEAHHVFSQLFGKIDVIIPDEAHDVCWRDSYIQLQDYYLPRNTRFLGLTATPWRTKTEEYLGQRFDEPVCAPQPPELVAINRIVTCRAFGYDENFDYKALRIGKNGDFAESDLERQALRPEALEIIVRRWIEQGQNLPTVAFCASVKHAQQLAEAFNRQGITATWQDGKTPTEVRESQDKALINRSLKVVCSVNTQVKGWNVKAVGCIIFTYPTMSKSKFFQAAGRGSRAIRGKMYYILLDFGGNIRHGSPTGYQDYDIGPKPLKKTDYINEKICPQCHLICSNFIAICPNCEYVFSLPEDPVPIEHDLLSIPLIELLTSTEREQIKLFRQAKKICYQRNRPPDEAINQFYNRYGFEPYYEWHYQAVLGSEYTDEEKQRFLKYLQTFLPENHAAQWLTINIHLEFGDHDRKPIVSTTQQTYPGWWEILQVSELASLEEAKAAYIRLSKNWQPNTNHDPDAPFRLKQLNWAWSQVLEVRKTSKWRLL